MFSTNKKYMNFFNTLFDSTENVPKSQRDVVRAIGKCKQTLCSIQGILGNWPMFETMEPETEEMKEYDLMPYTILLNSFSELLEPMEDAFDRVVEQRRITSESRKALEAAKKNMGKLPKERLIDIAKTHRENLRKQTEIEYQYLKLLVQQWKAATFIYCKQYDH